MNLEQLIGEGRYDEVCSILEPHSESGDSAASSNIAIIHRRRGDRARELFYALRSYAQDPRSGVAINTLLRAYRAQNLERPVAELYLASHDVLSLERIHHLWGAQALISINRTDEAQKALARVPGFPADTEHDLRIALLLALSLQDYDSAFTFVDRLEALVGPLDDERISMSFAAGQMQRAVALFDARSAADPAVAASTKPALLAALSMEDRAAVERLLQASTMLPNGLRTLATSYLNGDTEVVVAGDKGRYLFPFSPTNLSISLQHAGGRFYERHALDRLRTLLSPDDFVIDVGANIGNHSIYFAGEAGCRVQSFECNPRLVPLLQRAVSGSSLGDRIDLSMLGHAVSDRVGRVTFNFYRDDFSNISTDLSAGDDGVPALSIDSLQLDSCSLIKIDVDGGEMAVLEGAIETLARLRPTLAVEVLNTNMTRVLSWLAAQGYVVLREDTTGAAYSDFIVVHQSSRFRRI